MGANIFNKKYSKASHTTYEVTLLSSGRPRFSRATPPLFVFILYFLTDTIYNLIVFLRSMKTQNIHTPKIKLVVIN